ncbi:MAG: hypothetical protein ABWY11_10795 [Umezawaea sp.]
MTAWTAPGTQQGPPMRPIDPPPEFRPVALPAPPPRPVRQAPPLPPVFPVFPVLPPAGTVLHPLPNEEVTTRAKRITAWNSAPFIRTTIVMAIVVAGLSYSIWSTWRSDFGSTPGWYLGFALTALLLSVGHWFTTGCLSFVFACVAMGFRVTFADMRAWLKPVVWRLLGLSALCGVVVPVGLVAGVVPGVLAWVAFAVSAQALVLERLTVRQALTRSRDLVRGEWSRTFGILALTWRFSFLYFLFAMVGLRDGFLRSDRLPIFHLLAPTALVGVLLMGTSLYSGAVLAMYYVDRYLVVATRPGPSPVQQVAS